MNECAFVGVTGFVGWKNEEVATGKALKAAEENRRSTRILVRIKRFSFEFSSG